MALSAALTAKKREKKQDATQTYVGIKLNGEDSSALYALMGVQPFETGAAVLNEMIATVSGQSVPETEEKASKDGSRYFGKKVDINADDESTPFDSFAKLAEAVGVPANVQGAQLFRRLLEQTIEKLAEKAGVSHLEGEAKVQAIIEWRKNGGK